MLRELALFLGLLGLSNSAAAQPGPSQIVTDDTLLPDVPVTDIVAAQGGTGNYTIDQSFGVDRGPNLFFSFQDFSIGITGGTPDTVTFEATDFFDNVIARVTGGNPSNFDGTLRSRVESSDTVGADFYFLNPAGMFFGPSAVIDVPADLYLSTADALIVDDPGADLLPGTPLMRLSAAPPEAFGFLGGDPAEQIAFAANAGFPTGLELAPGATLHVSAGDVLFSNALTIRLPGGSAQLAAVGSSDAVVPVDLSSFDAAGLDPDAEVSLTGNSTSPPGAGGGPARLIAQDDLNPAGPQGEIIIRAGKFLLDRASLLAGGVPGGAPTIDVEAAGDVALSNLSAISAISLVGATEPMGEARVSASEIRVTENSAIRSQNRGNGRGADVVLTADTIAISAAGVVSASNDLRVFPFPTAPGGDVILEADDITIANASVSARSETEGPSGEVTIWGDRLRLVDGQVFTDGGQMSPSRGVNIEVGDVELRGALAQITTQNEVQSPPDPVIPGGDISIAGPGGSLVVTGGALIQASSQGPQPGGHITITTGDLEISDGGAIEAAAEAAGAGGSITITADQLAIVRSEGADTPGFLSSAVAEGATGNGGSIGITTVDLVLADGGQISTTTLGGGAVGGNAGNVVVTATGDVTLSGEDFGDDGTLQPTGIFARAEQNATGNSGSITVSGRTIGVLDGAEISARALNGRRSGDITLKDADTVRVSGFGSQGSVVTARGIDERTGDPNPGSGGDILVMADGVEVTDGGSIDVSTDGGGAGGRLSVTARNLLVSGVGQGAGGAPVASALAAKAEGGGIAGGIFLDVSGSLVVTDSGEITAISDGAGSGGNIDVQNPVSMLVGSGGLVSAQARGAADAGAITISGVGRLDLDHGSITTEAAQGLGGNVSIGAATRITTYRSEISARVPTGDGSGGNVDLTSQVIAVNKSQVVADADEGPGGNILITAQEYLRSADSIVDASSRIGVNGTVVVAAPEADLAGQLAPLPVEFLDARALLRSACAARTERTGSFVVQGPARVLAPPDAPLGAAAPADSAAAGCLAP